MLYIIISINEDVYTCPNWGSIEIMGMLVGKILGHSIIVMDTYRLPVEGTETQ